MVIPSDSQHIDLSSDYLKNEDVESADTEVRDQDFPKDGNKPLV